MISVLLESLHISFPWSRIDIFIHVHRPLVHVSADPKTLAKGVVKEWDGLTIGSLLPGMLVNARVRNVLSDGLLVSFLTYFNGTIDCFHLGQVFL